MAASRLSAWFDTDFPSGEFAVLGGTRDGALRLDTPVGEPTAPARRITVEIETQEVVPPGVTHLPDGMGFEVVRLNDPELESFSLGLMETDTAGIQPGYLSYMLVLVGPEGMHHAAYADADRARAFLEDEVEEAESNGCSGHWAEMLDGTFDDDGGYPFLMFDEDGLNVIDGRHRLAGLVANDRPGTLAILGVAEGFRLSDCPGVTLSVPGATFPEPPEAAAPGPR